MEPARGPRRQRRATGEHRAGREARPAPAPAARPRPCPLDHLLPAGLGPAVAWVDICSYLALRPLGTPG